MFRGLSSLPGSFWRQVINPIFLIIYSKRAVWTKHWSLKAGTWTFRLNLLMTSIPAQSSFAVDAPTGTTKNDVFFQGMRLSICSCWAKTDIFITVKNTFSNVHVIARIWHCIWFIRESTHIVTVWCYCAYLMHLLGEAYYM